MEFFGVALFSSLTGSTLTIVCGVMFVIGLVAIIKGGDWFVDSASWFASATGIPKFIVGATIVSFATTLPEMIVSVRAAMNGSTQLAIGNAIGSVTANTTLIMGISLIFMASAISRKSFSLKGILFLASAVSLTVISVACNLILPIWSVVILGAIFVIFMIDNVKQGKDFAEQDEIDAFEKKELPGKILFFILGTAGIILGAELLVGSGQTIATNMGISEAIIGFTVIALGTSLPELVTTLTAIKKKEASLSVGNIIGANVIDLTLILPICAIVSGEGLPVELVNVMLDFPVCIAAAAIAVIPTIIKGKFMKWQGFALLVMYFAYMACLVLNEYGVIAIG